MLDQSYIQWENENSLRAYPVNPDSGLVSDSGEVLPDFVIADLGMFVTDDGVIKNPAVSCVRISPSSVSVAISEQFSGSGNFSRGLLTIFVPRSTLKSHTPYAMTSAMPGVGGYIAFGDIIWPSVPKIYRYGNRDQNCADIVSQAYVRAPAPNIVSFVDQKANTSLSGVVEINLSELITAEVAQTATGYEVKFSLTDEGNELLATQCNVGNDVSACGTPIIKSINGVYPNSSGEIMIRFA